MVGMLMFLLSCHCIPMLSLIARLTGRSNARSAQSTQVGAGMKSSTAITWTWCADR